MAPQPLDQVNFMPEQQQQQQPRGSISLSILIDFIIQRTYHDLTVLAELLPRKTDMERKIEIYNFSARTRQLFIRLLALVKWAASASKVDKSAHIMSFLDKQSMLFVETADMLARMARETLVHARLPNFHIPAAVEILTTGTYGRLPTCIREKIVPPDPITLTEKRQTLLRLNQVIQHRLVTGNLMQQMRKFRIEGGRVTFRVDNEFEVSLTVMGDGPNVPWRLLDIEVLVEDKETGDGKSLVHALQVNYIHQLIQARLVDNVSALTEVYNCLHYFCQSLQLEVLYTQTLRLIRDRLQDNVFVDEYAAGTKLTVSYWRELTSKDPKSELGYKLTIQTDPTDAARPLAVIHVPSIGNKESFEVADRAVRSELLSMERLLVHTVYVRSLARLNEIKTELQLVLKDVEYHLQGTPAILTVPILSPCLRAEQIHITVDTHTGMFHCHVPKHLDCPLVGELQYALNHDHSKLLHLISEVRFWITYRRCEKTLQHLPATPHEHLPLLYAADHKIAKIGKHKVYIKLHRHPNVILIVELREQPEHPTEMEYVFYLVNVRQSSMGTVLNAAAAASSTADTPASSSSEAADTPKLYLEVSNVIEFDTFVITHGPGTFVDEILVSNSGAIKRKCNVFDPSQPATKQQKTIYPAYFIPELAHMVAMCDEKLPFVTLAQELSARQIPHGGLQVEANATSLVLKLLTLPRPATTAAVAPNSLDAPSLHKCIVPPTITNQVWTALMRRLLGVSVRAQVNRHNQTRSWTVELVFYSTPLPSNHHKEQGLRRPVYLQYDILTADNVGKTINQLLDDWSKIVHLYTLVHDFAEKYKSDKSYLQNIVVVKSYTYTTLLLGYGPSLEVTMNIFWCTDAKEFKIIFRGGIAATNAHAITRDQLQAHLNRHHNLMQIVHMLHETYQPLSSISKLPVLPQLGIAITNNARGPPVLSVLTFCILPQSPTLLRIIYQAIYCLEVRMRGSGLVSIRDGAYSRFDHCNAVNELMPTQGLKTFLSKYVDETAVYRRWSQSEDDNPPSPVAMEDSQGVASPFPSNLRGPQSPRDSGLRFQAPHTPPSVSNPHTPASPHPIGQQQHNFGMTSPPTSHMPHPSPSGGVGAGGSGPSGGMMPLSPAQPSPMANSPGPHSLTPYMQGNPAHTDGSPFAALSPAASNWPGSPNIPRPSPRSGQSPDHKPIQIGGGAPGGGGHHLNRVLPQRSWAGAVPTLLTQEALDTLCRPSPHPQQEIASGNDMSPLERFLGCAFMRKQLQRRIQTEDYLKLVPCSEPGVVMFMVDTIKCHVSLKGSHMQSLHIKMSQPPQQPPLIPDKLMTLDELLILEQFFDTRVVAPPYRPNDMVTFCRLLNIGAPRVLKDFIQIMRLELIPDLSMNFRWTVQLSLRVPPSAAPIVPVGMPSFLVVRTKILFFLQITRIAYGPGMDGPSLVLPIIYDTLTNLTQFAERRESPQSAAMMAANAQLRRFAEFHQQQQQNECSLLPAVRDLLMNLMLEGPGVGGGGGPGGVGVPNQIMSAPGMVGQPVLAGSPNQQMGHGPPMGQQQQHHQQQMGVGPQQMQQQQQQPSNMAGHYGHMGPGPN